MPYRPLKRFARFHQTPPSTRKILHSYRLHARSITVHRALPLGLAFCFGFLIDDVFVYDFPQSRTTIVSLLGTIPVFRDSSSLDPVSGTFPVLISNRSVVNFPQNFSLSKVSNFSSSLRVVDPCLVTVERRAVFAVLVLGHEFH